MLALMSLQPPFDGEDEDQLFDAILSQEIRVPRTLSLNATKCIHGVCVRACVLN